MRLIAHRGASGHAPENTMASFRLALELGARALEFDVHQTCDNELVVIHDEDLRRVGDRRDRIGALSFKELASVDVGSWFAPRFAGERVPRLSEVFDLAGPAIELHVELKSGSKLYPGIEERVVSLIARRDARRRAVVSSFDHEALFAARALDSRLRIGYLLGRTAVSAAWKELRVLRAESLHVSARQADARLAASCRERGLRLLVYTVNTAREAERMRRLGVDAIFTNYPELKTDEGDSRTDR